MWVCGKCGALVSDGDRCPDCNTADPRAPEESKAKTSPLEQPSRVVATVTITDIRIPVYRWIGILVDIAMAAVPAAIIAAIAWWFIGSVIAGSFGGGK